MSSCQSVLVLEAIGGVGCILWSVVLESLKSVYCLFVCFVCFIVLMCVRDFAV